MELINLLRSVEMFAGLDEAQLKELAGIFESHELKEGDVLFSQGDIAGDLFVVSRGFVEVVREQPGEANEKVIVNLGPGQSIGEMSLVDRGTRSATIRSVVDDTVVVSVSKENFEAFCKGRPEIGYLIMRNIAADLSFRLRRRNV